MHAATKKESCWSDGLKTDHVYHRRLIELCEERDYLN